MSFIKRAPNRELPFFQVDRETAQDMNMSWQAKGLHTFCLSQSPEWKMRVDHLANISKCSKNTIYSMINELISNGYCEREQMREPNGRLSSSLYTIHEIKMDPGVDQKVSTSHRVPDYRIRFSGTDNIYVNNNNKKGPDQKTDKFYMNLYWKPDSTFSEQLKIQTLAYPNLKFTNEQLKSELDLFRRHNADMYTTVNNMNNKRTHNQWQNLFIKWLLRASQKPLNQNQATNALTSRRKSLTEALAGQE